MSKKLGKRDEYLIAAARKFMLVYFSDGKKKRPSDFDEDILGGQEFNSPLSMRAYTPKWNNTYFSLALGDLVEEGIVKSSHDKDGYKYFLAK